MIRSFRFVEKKVAGGPPCLLYETSTRDPETRFVFEDPLLSRFTSAILFMHIGKIINHRKLYRFVQHMAHGRYCASRESFVVFTCYRVIVKALIEYGDKNHRHMFN